MDKQQHDEAIHPPPPPHRSVCVGGVAEGSLSPLLAAEQKQSNFQLFSVHI